MRNDFFPGKKLVFFQYFHLSDENKNKSQASTQAADGATLCEKQKDMGVRRHPQHRSAAW